jgi:sec-independent protein translocase protein TatA
VFRDFGWPEALIILAVVLIIFGAGKLPQIGGAIGKSIREFRKAKDGVNVEEAEEEKPESKKTTRKLTTPKTRAKQG